MAISFFGIFKALRIQDPADRTKQLRLEVDPASTTGTSTTIVANQTANRVVTLPDSNFDFNTVITTSSTSTLTNKTIDGDDNTIQDLALSSLKTNLTDADKFLVRDGSGIVISNTKDVPTGDVVGNSDAQTLTNKTIDADANTISNIENDDIKVGAAISRAKLASGTADHVLINDGSGVMSSEAQLDISRGGTGEATANDALNALLPDQSGHAGEFLTTDGTDTSWAAAGGSGATLGTYQTRGIRGVNNATNATTEYDLTADVVVLKNSSNEIVVRYNPGTIVNNILTAGPTANGRDQAGAFTGGSFIHFYWIWNGTTLATLSSATAPPTGPTLPSGYTHWAYAGPIYFNVGNALNQSIIRGAWVYRSTRNYFTTTANSTIGANISLAGDVPTNALAYDIIYLGAIVASGAGAVEASFTISAGTELTGGGPLLTLETSVSGLANSSTYYPWSGRTTLPYTGNNFNYQWQVASGSSQNASIAVMGYKIANGGE